MEPLRRSDNLELADPIVLNGPTGRTVRMFVLRTSVYRSGHQSLRRFLSTEELLRADRYRFERDRIRYIVARGLLRTVLGSEIGISASAVRFAYGDRGKPRIILPALSSPIHFNLSHSEDLVVIALSDQNEVGIDAERVEPRTGIDTIVEQFFNPIERKTYDRLSQDERLYAFYRWWTQREAVMKAVGLGLELGFRSFSVEVDPSQPASIVECRSPQLMGVQLLEPQTLANNLACTAIRSAETPIELTRE